MNIASAVFKCSAPDLASCPDESLPEFAFIGRSNVGKSSLLNMLSGRPDLARVSRTPGFTKLINFFTINKSWRLVDLPGYGYAHVARKDKARFNRAVTEYLRKRENLCCVFALIDSGLTPQSIDLEFVEWLVGNAVPFVLVFTKIDAVPPATVQSNIDAFTDRLSEWCENLPEIFTCSATAKHGRTKLLELIAETVAGIQGDAQEDLEPDSPPGGVHPSDGSAGSRKAKRGGPPREKKPNPSRPW